MNLADLIKAGRLIGSIKAGTLWLSDGTTRTIDMKSTLKKRGCKWDKGTKAWWCKATTDHTAAIIERARQRKHELSLAEPINYQKMKDIIQYIEERKLALQADDSPETRDKSVKALKILRYLCKWRDNPTRVVNYDYRRVGRLYAAGESKTNRSCSLPGCYKGLRASLVGHVGHDIDVANSLPEIAVQLGERLYNEGLADLQPSDYAPLKRYNQERSQWLPRIMEWHGCDRDSAKKLVLIALFGGNPRYSLNDRILYKKNLNELHRPLEALVTSLATFRRKMVSYYVGINKTLKSMYEEKLKTKGSEEGAERGMFAIITHMEEDKAMKIIRDYLTENGVQIFALIYDGLIASSCRDTLLRGAEERLAESGFDLKLEEKPLYGMQDEPISELEHLKDIEPCHGKRKREGA